MKAELVKKTDEFIEHLLKKPDLTVEEYMILDKKLGEIKLAEAEAARKLAMEDSDKRVKAMLDALMIPLGGGTREQ